MLVICRWKFSAGLRSGNMHRLGCDPGLDVSVWPMPRSQQAHWKSKFLSKRLVAGGMDECGADDFRSVLTANTSKSTSGIHGRYSQCCYNISISVGPRIGWTVVSMSKIPGICGVREF